MSAPATVAEFLGLVYRSGLLKREEGEAFLARLRETESEPDKPEALASVLVRDGLLSPFQAEQLLRGKWQGFVLGKYRILDRLGAGGMAAVFLAEHVRMRRPVALKVLPPDHSDDPASLERFHREARAVAALNHPNIVRAYDIDAHGKMHFLVMEYIDGVNLHDLVAKHGRLDPTRAAHYIRQAAVGLHQAHQAGLVHRDIKPSNLLLNRAGVVKVLDMGLARFFHDETDALTREHDGMSVLGTADYLAPEQGRDSHGVDIRADLYSLGATFYFLLVGHPPFAEGSLNQKLIWHQVRTPPPVHTLRPDVPEGMSAAIAKLLAKSPDDRFQTPAKLATALAEWTRNPIPPPQARELPPPNPALRGARLAGAMATSSSWDVGLDAVTGVDLTGSTAVDPGPVPAAVLPPPAEAPKPAGQDWKGIADEARPAADGPSPPPPIFHRFLKTVRSRRWLWAAIATAVVAVGVVGLCLVLYWRSNSTAPPPSPPSAPVHLQAKAWGGDAVDLAWEQPAGEVKGFKIERASDPAFTHDRTLVAVLHTNVLHYTDEPAAAGTGYYRVRATGPNGESGPSNVAWPPPAYDEGFRSAGLAFNGGPFVINGVLHLTDLNPGEARSVFYRLPLDVQTFHTTFRFRIAANPAAADGFTFCIQRAGPTAVGAAGGGLGYEGVGKSVAIKFDLFDNMGEGVNSTGLYTNGAGPYQVGALDLTPSGVNLHGGQTYEVTADYAGHTLDVKITDVADATKSFHHEFPIDIVATVGDRTAYVGFTGGTGGPGALQDILSWTWTAGEK